MGKISPVSFEHRAVSDEARQNLRIVIAACALTFLAGLNTGWSGPLIPRIAQANDIDLGVAGSMVSVSAAGSMLMLILGKIFCEKLGSRNCLRLSAVIIGAGMVAVAMGPNLAILALGAFIVGCGTGLNSIASTTSVLLSDTASSAAALNKVNLFFGIGALAGPQIAWAGLSSPWSYHAVYFFGAAFALISALVLKIQKPTAKYVAPPEVVRSQILGKPLLWLYALVIYIYVGMEVSSAAWLFAFLQNYCALDLAMASISMTVLWSGLTGGRMVSVFLCDRYSSAKITIMGILLSASAFFALATAGHGASAGISTLAMVLLLGIGFGPIFPNILAAANEHFKPDTTTTSTVVISCGAVGGITVPLLTGYCFTHVGWQLGMFVLCGFDCIMLLLFLLLLKITKKTRSLSDGSIKQSSIPAEEPPAGSGIGIQL